MDTSNPDQTNDLQGADVEESVVSVDSKVRIDLEITPNNDSCELQQSAEVPPDANGVPQASETSQSIEETIARSPIQAESQVETVDVDSEEVVEEQEPVYVQTVESVDEVTMDEPTVGASEDIEMAEPEPEPSDEDDDEIQENIMEEKEQTQANL